MSKLKKLKQEVAPAHQILEKEQQENLGKPQVNKHFALNDRLPLVDRMQTILTNKSRRLEDIQKARKLKEEAELRECTFKPVTNNKQPPKGDVDRLFDWAKAKQSKMADLALKNLAVHHQSRSARKQDPQCAKSPCSKQPAEPSSQKALRRQPGVGQSPAGCLDRVPRTPSKKPSTASKSPSFARQRQALDPRPQSKESGDCHAITVEQLCRSASREHTAAARQIEKHLKSLAASVKHQQVQK